MPEQQVEGITDEKPGKLDKALIELKGVGKTYRSAAGAFAALDGIDLSVGGGEYLAVVGKSGSGKSTLINMITGIDRPTAGKIFVGGTAVHELSENRAAAWRGRTVGLVFQFFQLLPTLTVAENVMLPMDFGRTYPSGERKARALSLLDRVDVAGHANKMPTALSGGERQRVAIARAMANDPPLIVADEPTGNLDSKSADAIYRLFDGLAAAGKTLVVVSHDPNIAQRASRVVTIADGRITGEQRKAIR